MAVVEAFPPLPKPVVTGSKTKNIIYDSDSRKDELVCAYVFICKIVTS